MTITVQDFYNEINRAAPFSTAEDWDNSGLMVGSGEASVQRALLALDVTPAVLDEAKLLRCQLIISHHPVIFSALKKLPTEHIVYRLAAAGISVISAHTNLDIAGGGVNDALAARLGLTDTRPLATLGGEAYKRLVVFVPENYAERVYNALCEAGAGQYGNYESCAFLAPGEGRFLPAAGANPAVGRGGELERVKEIRLEMLVRPDRLEAALEKLGRSHPYEQPAYDVLDNLALSHMRTIGRVGALPEPMQAKELAAYVKERLCAAGVRLAEGRGKISLVAVCGGSGAEYLADAKKAGAQALVTGEAKHQDFLSARELGVALIDAGHFATEAVVLEPLRVMLRERLPGAELIISKADTDGVKYI